MKTSESYSVKFMITIITMTIGLVILWSVTCQNEYPAKNTDRDIANIEYTIQE